MAENKTRPTETSVSVFLDKIPDEMRREDCFALVELMRAASKLEPVMWGSAIVGFGSHHYVYESGREGDTVILGFSPRKQNIAIYLLGGHTAVGEELSALGKYKTGGGCFYLKTLGDVNTAVLGKIFAKVCKAAAASKRTGTARRID